MHKGRCRKEILKQTASQLTFSSSSTLEQMAVDPTLLRVLESASMSLRVS